MAYMYSPGGLATLVEDPAIQRHNLPRLTPPTGPEVQALSALTKWMIEQIYTAGYMPSIITPQSEQALYILVRSYSLAFLRKATIFLHVSHGVDFAPSSDHNSPEFDRLSRLLKLPSLFDALFEFQAYRGNHSIKEQVSGWILSLAKHQHSKQIEEGHYIPRDTSETFGDPEIGPLIVNFSRNMALPHPVPFELIGLPKYFDVLMEEANRRKCPTTGKDLTDPALCLFCGEIFCSQAACCMKNKIGPANLHVEKYVSPPSGALLPPSSKPFSHSSQSYATINHIFFPDAPPPSAFSSPSANAPSSSSTSSRNPQLGLHPPPPPPQRNPAPRNPTAPGSTPPTSHAMARWIPV